MPTFCGPTARMGWGGRKEYGAPSIVRHRDRPALYLHPTPPSLLALMPYLEAKYPTCCELSRFNGRLQQRFIFACFHTALPPSLSVFVTLAGSPHLLLRARVTGSLARSRALSLRRDSWSAAAAAASSAHRRYRAPKRLACIGGGAFYDSRH